MASVRVGWFRLAPSSSVPVELVHLASPFECCLSVLYAPHAHAFRVRRFAPERRECRAHLKSSCAEELQAGRAAAPGGSAGDERPTASCAGIGCSERCDEETRRCARRR
jgi:hypothetical protein